MLELNKYYKDATKYDSHIRDDIQIEEQRIYGYSMGSFAEQVGPQSEE